ncbi:MAG: RNA polymerase sigma factor [Candidatus Shapirobacteria bacterium]
MLGDEKIVQLIQRGDKEKFGEIIKRYQGKLFGYIKNLINQNNMEVEDVVEDALISAYENLNGFDTSKKFSSWIYRIAHNKAVDYFKKGRVKTENLEDKEEMLEIGKKLIEEMEIEKENKARINRAVDDLELKYKEVIILYFFENKNYEEISDILHISVSGVGVLLYRAKEKLRKILKNEK